jgi:UDP-N-acetylglucosamine 4,6-dehydratase/5-epimerase
MSGRSILVTGGTGSAGSALIRHLCATTTAGTWRRIICFSRDEWKQGELQRTLTDERLRFWLGDVRDVERLRLAFKDVQVVIHTAAMKQVPAMEANPIEAVQTNILGSLNVMRAALDGKVEKVLALSTDKAVAAVNLYGGSKFVMERLLLAANSYYGPAFSIVRYGNVARSRGSVIPVWRWQQAHGQPITLTSPDATRFWITLPQAVAFIDASLSRMTGGELFVPRMPSVRLGELARLFTDIPQVTGLRVGEKLHETVIGANESVAGLPSPYTSDGNTEWLEGEALQEAVACV